METKCRPSCLKVRRNCNLRVAAAKQRQHTAIDSSRKSIKKYRYPALGLGCKRQDTHNIDSSECPRGAVKLVPSIGPQCGWGRLQHTSESTAKCCTASPGAAYSRKKFGDCLLATPVRARTPCRAWEQERQWCNGDEKWWQSRRLPTDNGMKISETKRDDINNIQSTCAILQNTSAQFNIIKKLESKATAQDAPHVHPASAGHP